ncbi:TPA: DUF3601 domain-containing protein [Kluyvera intermedia]|uniref:DUF3601 domain-containing protein n=1 Tax=Kluyvera intermedia TaxID=61648 RepID=A0ABX3UBN3_KLUIN|nr:MULTISPECIES: DUF3601 domain-containing protein [Enterobacteriaceae]MCL9670232.1 DUF3601 domain-containing protein [Citrobacter sp. MNAZ 1397]ORJ48360.1 hypothetical protein B2M27_20990 [Kluyvera intermedia]HAT2607819.1 DUF3601 domain-containing protein [Kluyvera intermedia]
MDTHKLKQTYRHLVAGKYYKVTKTFVDYDRFTRCKGDVWKFVGSSYLAYEDGLSLFFSIKGKVVQIRLQAIPEEQGHITEHLEQYLAEHHPWWRFW